MPVNYQIPPWLNPVSPVEPFLQGAALAQRAQAEQNATRLKQQQMAMEAAQYSQDYDLRRAQAEAEIALRRQTVEERQSIMAARTLAMKRIQEDIDRGVPVSDAYARNLAGLLVSPTSVEGFGSALTAALRPGALTGTATMRELDEADRLDAEAIKLQQAGRMEQAQQAQQRATILRAKYNRPGVTIMDPNTGNPLIQMGGTQTPGEFGMVSPASRAQWQQKLTRYESALELLNKLRRELGPGDVGARGVFGEYVVDRALAQLDPNLAVGQRIKKRAALTSFREGLMREISNDYRFSNADAARVDVALPSTGTWESLPDAQGKMDEVGQILRDRANAISRSIGIERPLWSLSQEEIRQQYQRKKAELERQIQLMQQQNRPLDVQRLTEQLEQYRQNAADILTRFYGL